ncbi:TetR/AcrR family transcriptional regulator [Streptomyces sp. NPDC056242]|uniref:TetR/AcrR family transcriptional regulator n=1 Tax=Streptomyces sp. NPDC056242 TaxID=3345760 RepID=UPI0035DEC89F
MQDNRSGTRRRGPNASTPARRAQIVRAALESFARHGFERASLRDIAARAGVTHAALLHHFSGKDELLLAALAQREDEERATAEKIMNAGGSGGAVLSAVMREELKDLAYQRSWMALAVAATDPDHPAHDFFVGRRARMRTSLNDDTTGAVPLTVDDKATLILAMMDGVRMQALMEPSRDPLGVLEVFMRTLIARGPQWGEGASL